MGVIDNFVNSLASVVHNKRKDDEERKRKEDAQKQVFHESEFKKSDKSIVDKAGDFVKGLVDNGAIGVGNNSISKFTSDFAGKMLEESGKLAQKMPDTTINIKATPTGKKKTVERFDFQTGQMKRENVDDIRYSQKVGPLEIPVSEAGAKAIPLISSMPGDIIRSYGNTAARLGNEKGRTESIKDLAKLPGQVIDTVKDPSKLPNLFQNKAVEDASNISDFLPGIGLLSISSKKAAKEGVEQVVKKGIFNTAEAKAVQSVFVDRLNHTMQTSTDPKQALEAVKKITEDGIKSSSGNKSVLAGMRTALNKMMFDFAGSVGTDYKANYANLKAMMEDPDLGPILTHMEDSIHAIDNHIIGNGEMPMTQAGKEAISSGVKVGEFNNSMNIEAGRPPAGTQVSPSSTSSLEGKPPSSVIRNTSPSNRTNFVASFNISSPSQDDFNRYYKEMQTVKKPLFDQIQNVLNDTGGQATYRLKTQDSIIGKLDRNDTRRLGTIGDTHGATIIVDSPEGVNKALESAKKNMNIVGEMDYRQSPTFLGYKSIHLDNELPNGASSEVQIMTKDDLYRKGYAHEIYDKWRKYIEHNGHTTFDQVVAHVRNKEPERVGEFEADVQKSIDIYDGKVAIPQKNIDEVNKQLATTAQEMGGQTVKKELSLISAERGVQQSSAEVSTKLWEGEYKPKLEALLEKAKGAPESEVPAIRDQIKTLEKEFSDKVDGVEKSFKERGFITSVKEEKSLSDPIRQGVEGEYKVRANEELKNTAQARIDADPVGTLEEVLHSGTANDEQVAMAIDYLRRFNNAGNTARAVDVVEKMATKLTEAGRTVQAASLLGRLTPEGALIYTQRIINKATKKGGSPKKISEQSAKEITDLAKKVKELPEGEKKVRAIAKLSKRMGEEVPSSFLRKVSTLQTIAQLLNPKTFIRNTVGNIGFAGIENVKDVVAAPLDMAIGLVTKERYKTLPSITTQLKGFAKGFKEGVKDSLQGIDTGPSTSKFDLNKKPAFATKSTDNIVKKVVYKPLDMLERVTNLTLKAMDRASYQAAHDESLRQMMKTNKVTVATEKMKELANLDGLHRTFQDDTVASKAFSRIKSGLNAGKEFGVGDLVLKYPKTPGNILARSIEYSPIGFFSSAINLGKMVLGKEASQKAFVESTARAITGSTALLGTGALLYKMGIITGKPGTDPDIKALDKNGEGVGDYSINISGLKRFLLEGFDPEKAKPKDGDTVISYDWFQPQSIGFAMGADIEANKGVNSKTLVGTLLGSMTSASNTLVEQPLVSGLSRLFNYGDLSGGVAETLTSAPSSFTPTLLNQVKQLMDNTVRDPQDPDLFVKGQNLFKNRLPLINRDNPASYDTQGRLKEQYQNGSNNWFNVFFNPSFVSKIEKSELGTEIKRLYGTTGESSQAPRQQGNSIQINGTTKKLTGEEKQRYQQYIGEKTRKYFEQAMKKDAYKNMTDEEKIKALTNILTDVSVAAKHELFGHNPKKVARKDRVRKIMDMPDPIPLIAR